MSKSDCSVTDINTHYCHLQVLLGEVSLNSENSQLVSGYG